MTSAEREPITGVWGQSPQQGPGAEPPEAERVLAVGRPVEAANFPHSMHFKTANYTQFIKKIVSYSYREKAHDGAA